MRQLFPTYVDDVDLIEAYRYPSDRTWVRANMVASVDGSAVYNGTSRDLSNAADHQVFRVLRGMCDAVLVGAGTARTERYRGLRAHPEFAAQRARLGQPPAPVLALVSNRLDLDVDSELFRGVARTIVFTAEGADAQRRGRLGGVADVVVAGGDEVELEVAVAELFARGLTRVLCEGGPSLLADVIAAKCLDELCLTLSPKLVGGDGARIVSGSVDPGVGLTLAHVLEEDGTLFTRYEVV